MCKDISIGQRYYYSNRNTRCVLGKLRKEISNNPIINILVGSIDTEIFI